MVPAPGELKGRRQWAEIALVRRALTLVLLTVLACAPAARAARTPALGSWSRAEGKRVSELVREALTS